MIKNGAMDIPTTVKKALKFFSSDIVKNAERIYRLETNHFKSGQFKGTYSPGMEKVSNTYPYGWSSLYNSIWKTNPEYKPIGLKTFTENQTGISKTFLKFPTFEAGFFTLCAFLKIFNNNPGRWFSLDKTQQEKYNKSISSINTDIYDSIS
jgi:hypothetical protein